MKRKYEKFCIITFFAGLGCCVLSAGNSDRGFENWAVWLVIGAALMLPSVALMVCEEIKQLKRGE